MHKLNTTILILIGFLFCINIVSAWDVNLISPINGFNSSSNNIIFTFNTSTDAPAEINFTLWSNFSGVWAANNTNISSLANGTIGTISLNSLSDGNYIWNINASNDTEHNFSSNNYTLNIDTVNPSIQFVAPTENNNTYWSRNWIYANVSITETNHKRTNITLYNSSLNLISSTSQNQTNFTALSDGIYYINATAYDQAGNSNKTETRMIILDRTYPIINITYPQQLNYSSNVSAINYTITETNKDKCWYSNGTANISIQNAGLNFTNVMTTEGSNTFTVYCNDSAGNMNQSSITFFKDTVYPLISFDSLTETNNSYKSQNYIQSNVTLTETNFKNITFRINSSSSFTSTSLIYVYNFTSLANGIYNYNVTICDISGNCNSTETRRIILDTLNPQVTFGSRTTNASNLSQNWIYANVSITDTNYNRTNITLYNSSLDLINSVSLNQTNFTALSDGIYYINATAYDQAGNSNKTETRMIILDTTAPSISNPRNYSADLGAINNNDTVILNATVTDLTTSVDKVWISGNWTGNWTNYTIAISGGNYNYTINTSYLLNQKTIAWQYFANDSVGNRINSTIFSFRVEDRPLYFKNMTNFSTTQDIRLPINLSNFTVDLDRADPALTFGGNLGFCTPNCAINSTNGMFEWTPNYLNYGWYNLTFNVTDGLVTITNTTYIYVYGTLNITNTTFNSVIINKYQTIQDIHPGDLVTIVVNTVSLGNQTIDNVTLTLNISGMYYGSMFTPGNWSQVPSVNRTFSFMIPTIINESVYNASILASGNNHWPEYIRYDYFNFSINLTKNVDDIIIENVTLSSNNLKCIAQTTISLNLTNKGLKNYSDITLKIYNSSLGLNYTLFNVSVTSASYNDTLVFNINTSNKTAGNYTIIAKINYYNSFLTNITYTKNITLTIINCEPEFINNPIPDITLAEDSLNYTLNLSYYFTDFNNDSLVYTLKGNTTNLSFNNFASTGLINITPAANYVGTNLINFTVNDTKGGINYTNMILVNITNVNDVPTISVNGQTFQENVTKTFYIIGNDIDPTNDTLTYGTNATFGTLTQINNSYALFNFTPSNSDVGVYSVLFNVSDGMNVTNATITITVVNSNDAPNLTAVSNKSVNESKLLQFNLIGSDIDVNDTLTYSCNLSLLTVVKINNTLANVTWTPTEPQVGNYSVNCSVNDLVGARDSKIFTINVLPYHIVYYPSTNPVVGSGMTQIFNFSLPTGATLVASTWKDNGVNVASNTYSYTFGPETIPGTYHVRVEVQDNTGTNYTHDWYAQVTGYPIDDPYVATPDLSNSSLNLSNIVNLTIRNGNSMIQFLNPVNLAGVADLGGHVYIQGTIAGVDTSVLSMLNGPARITLTGLSLTATPTIYYSINYTTSGSDITYVCPTSICNLISWTSTTMVFNVTGFSSYRVPGASSGSGTSTNPNQSAILEINDVDLSEEEPKPDELVEITVDIENSGDIDIDNINLEIRLLDEDGNSVEDADGDDLEDDSEFDLSDDDSQEEKFTFRMPIDAEDGEEYTVDIVACGDSDDDTEECAYDNSTTIKISREKHEVIIDSATITPSSINCFDSFDVNLVLKDIGGKDEDVILTVKNDELEISKTETIELEADDEDNYKKSLSYAFSAANDLEEGTYDITIKADYSDNTVTKTLQLTKGVCSENIVDEQEEIVDETIVVTLDQNKVVTTPAPEPNMLPEKAAGFTDSFEYIIMIVILSILALAIIIFAIGAIIIRL